ncbi:Serine/threonine-protein kinase ATG1a [Halotydeus destructor]|nr:Serine/threonine-protein kinase ATG1a [Halotydeus destructor]
MSASLYAEPLKERAQSTVFQLNDIVFDFTNTIGSGNFGSVYKGNYLRKSRKQVAVKVLTLGSQFQDGDCKSFDEFEDQIEKLYTLAHPYFFHFVKPLEVLFLENKACIAMQYCHGGDLAEYMKSHRQMKCVKVKWFLHQMAVALAALQEAKVVHGDIKPSNILIDYNPKMAEPYNVILKVSDFAVARVLRSDSYATINKDDLRHFAAPEVLKKRKCDSRIDVYSVGMILFACLTGRLPFDTDDYQCHINFVDGIARPTQHMFPAGTELELIKLVNRMISVEPSKRLTIKQLLRHDYLRRGYFCLWQVHAEVLTKFFEEPLFSSNLDIDLMKKESFAVCMENKFKQSWKQMVDNQVNDKANEAK